jgi:hypothetical protein
MGKYQPLYIKGMEKGLVQSREEFILPDDAYPTLENAFVWRERIKRKQGTKLLGRLRRIMSAVNLSGGGATSENLITKYSLDATAEIEVGSVVVTDGVNTLTDNSLGVLAGSVGSGTINYATGAITTTGLGVQTVAYNYFPCLPVMGIRIEETDLINNEITIFFDTKYAYKYLPTGFQEFIPGTTWTGQNYNFFWSTNYWSSTAPANKSLFWVTNFSGVGGDPIRYTDGTTWTNFGPTAAPTTGQIDSAGNFLTQCLCLLPFRGRLIAFNTLEGTTLATSVAYTNRIRWAAIGNPLITNTASVPGSWRDDVTGKGGFLDIPTTEDIISVGFVRDNLVIYCERSTWQLRYTGRSIQPFQIEKVNSELGASSTFSAIQFDTSLVGVGDKGIVQCDSYKSDYIDIKIPDLVINGFNSQNQGRQRVYGIRDFERRLAYWTYVVPNKNTIFPDRRLVYNYENDSWAIFTDCFTCLGTLQIDSAPKWNQYPHTGITNSPNSWQNQNFTWNFRPPLFPSIIGGNQEGFISFLDEQVSNDFSLSITDITGNTTTATELTVLNHNLQNGQIIQIDKIPIGTPFASTLNGNFFLVDRKDKDTIRLLKPIPPNKPQTDAPDVYIGGGRIAVKDNFRIISKKFNFLDDGENIQLGFIDVLLNKTTDGEITLNVYMDYNNSDPINAFPENKESDTFFNVTVPTKTISGLPVSKNWQRVFCSARGAFLTLEWTLSNDQMISNAQGLEVEIASQILWIRKAGRQLPVGV